MTKHGSSWSTRRCFSLSNLLGVQIREPRAAIGAEQTKTQGAETGDDIRRAACAGLAHDAARRRDREHQGDQKALRELREQRAFARRCDQIDASAPAAEKTGSGDRPPGERSNEL